MSKPELKIRVPFFKRWRVMRAVVECDELTELSKAELGFAVYADQKTWNVMCRRVDFVPPAGMVEIYRTKT